MTPPQQQEDVLALIKGIYGEQEGPDEPEAFDVASLVGEVYGEAAPRAALAAAPAVVAPAPEEPKRPGLVQRGRAALGRLGSVLTPRNRFATPERPTGLPAEAAARPRVAEREPRGAAPGATEVARTTPTGQARRRQAIDTLAQLRAVPEGAPPSPAPSVASASRAEQMRQLSEDPSFRARFGDKVADTAAAMGGPDVDIRSAAVEALAFPVAGHLVGAAETMGASMLRGVARGAEQVGGDVPAYALRDLARKTEALNADASEVRIQKTSELFGIDEGKAKLITGFGDMLSSGLVTSTAIMATGGLATPAMFMMGLGEIDAEAEAKGLSDEDRNFLLELAVSYGYAKIEMLGEKAAGPQMRALAGRFARLLPQGLEADIIQGVPMRRIMAKFGLTEAVEEALQEASVMGLTASEGEGQQYTATEVMKRASMSAVGGLIGSLPMGFMAGMGARTQHRALLESYPGVKDTPEYRAVLDDAVSRYEALEAGEAVATGAEAAMEVEERPGLRRRVADLIDPSRKAEVAEAFTDPMTGLPNQTAFEKTRERRDADPAWSVGSLDLVEFKAINDIIGREAGDARLAEVATILTEEAEARGIDAREVQRAGGDEFAVWGQDEAVVQEVIDAAVARLPDLQAGEFTSRMRGAVGPNWLEAEAATQAAKAEEVGPKSRSKKGTVAATDVEEVVAEVYAGEGVVEDIEADTEPAKRDVREPAPLETATDLFGEEEAVGAEQPPLFEEGAAATLVENEEDARAIVSSLEGKVARGDVTEDERRQYADAQKFLNRDEAITAAEIEVAAEGEVETGDRGGELFETDVASPSGIPADPRGGYRKLVTEGREKYDSLSDDEIAKKWGEFVVSRARTGQRAGVQHGQTVGFTNAGDRIAGTGKSGRRARGNDTQMRARIAALESLARSRGIELDVSEAFTEVGQSQVLEENKDLVGRGGTALTSMSDDDLALAIVETMEKWEGNQESDWLNERMNLLYHEAESREADDMMWLFGGAPPVAGVAPVAGAEVVPAPEAAPKKKVKKKKAQPVPPPEEGGPRIVSLRKEEGAEIRERLGLDALDAPGVQSFEDVWDEAMEQDAARYAVDVASEAVANKRALTPVEHAAAVQRYVELERELESSRALLKEAAKDENDVVVQREVARSARLLDEIDALTTATDRAGTEAGRALSVRRLRANVDDYTLARGLQVARTKKGAALTPDEIAQIEELTREVEVLQTTNSNLVSENADLIAKRDKAVAEAAVKAETRAARSGGQRTKNRLKKLTRERTDLLSQLGALGYRLNDVTGVSVEGLELIGKLAVNRIQTAATERGEKLTLDTVVKEVLADLNNEDVTARDVHEALAGRSPKAARKAESMAQQHVRELKTQATILAKIDDAERGITAPKKTRAQRSAEVTALQKRLTELRTNAYRSVREGDRLESALRTIDELQDQLAGVAREVAPTQKRRKAEVSPELAAVRRQITALRSELRTQGAIADLTEQIRTGTITPSEKRDAGEVSTSLSAMRAELRELRAQATLMEKIAKAERGVFEGRRTPAQRSAAVAQLQRRLAELRRHAERSTRDEAQTARALKTIEELQAQLEGGFRPVRPGRAQAEVTPDMKALKDKIAGLRRELATEDALSDIQEQLRTGDFRLPQARAELYTSPALERNQIALRRARQQWRQAILDMRPMGPRRVISEVTGFLRTMKATADMSATLRQGFLLSAGRPVMATRAFGQSARAFFSQHASEEIDNAIRQHPNQLLRDRAGLELTAHGGAMSQREEDFASNLAERIPVFGAVVRASNRSMTTTLNLIRTAAFDQFVEAHPNATQDEMKAWADWVNVASGRGNLGRARAVATELSTIFFAPRFAASRVQSPYMLFKHWKQPRVRREIAKDYAAVLGTGIMALTLASLAGLSVGTDPREADFGRIRFGDTRVDIWAGVQQPIRLLTRIALGITDRAGLTGRHLSESQKEVDPLELVGRFTAFKLAPSLTIPLELYRGETAVGEPVTPPQTAVRALLPILYEGVYDSYRQSGVGAAAVAGTGEFLGLGIQTYGDSQSRVRRDAQRMLSEGNRDDATTLMLEWNAANPERRIMSVRSGPDTLALPSGGGRGRSRSRSR